MKATEPTVEVDVIPPPRCRICGDFMMQTGRCMGEYTMDVNSVRAHRLKKAKDT